MIHGTADQFAPSDKLRTRVIVNARLVTRTKARVAAMRTVNRVLGAKDPPRNHPGQPMNG